MLMTEPETQVAIDSLINKQLITDQTGLDYRVTKYKHWFCNPEFSDLQFTPAQFYLICLLLLKGTQTPGQLKSYSDRLHKFADLNEVDSALNTISQTKPPFT